jgi:outer membrane protein assembly factor BamB
MRTSRVIVALVAASLLLVGCSSQFRYQRETTARPSAWPYPRLTVTGTGAMTGDSIQFNGQLEPIWELKFGDKPAGPLTIAHQMLVYPSSRKRLRFVDLATGENLGMIRIKGVPQTGALIHDSIAYLGVMPPMDRMIALDLRRRKVLWNSPIKDPAPGSIIVNGRVIANSIPGQVVALSAIDGKVAWQVDVKGRLAGAVSARDSLILIPTDRGELVALSAADGHQVWRAQLDGPGVAAVAIGELIFTTDVRGNVLAVSPDDGAVVWRTQAGGPIWGSPATADGKVVVGHSGGEIVALDARTGARMWSFATVEVVRSSPIIVGAYVVAGTMGGKLFSLRLSDGSLVARQQVTGAISCAPVTDGRRIYAATASGRIVCYGENNGQLPKGRH